MSQAGGHAKSNFLDISPCCLAVLAFYGQKQMDWASGFPILYCVPQVRIREVFRNFLDISSRCLAVLAFCSQTWMDWASGFPILYPLHASGMKATFSANSFPRPNRTVCFPLPSLSQSGQCLRSDFVLKHFCLLFPFDRPLGPPIAVVCYGA
jgi:hypothetical protein